MILRVIIAFLVGASATAQTADDFFRPADSLNKSRRNAAVIAVGSATAITYASLGSTWYSDYPRADFHFVNDNIQWLQMDKAGHVYASYHLGRFGTEILDWSGVGKRDQLLYGAGFGFAFISAIEILDGYSAKWGASWGDIAANAGGTALFVSQELLWKEQRIVPKFSFHTTPYASARPDALGSNVSEQILKDYNGQTYWLSANINSFAKSRHIPEWLNFAVGYGAEGMITGDPALVNSVFFPEKERVRQFYFSFDIDLTRIETKSHVIKTLFSIFNTIKIPAPTLEINEKGLTKFHFLYF